jgi:predicted DNA-binding transcriptional regulator AlpA
MSKVIVVDWKYLKNELKLPWSRQHWKRLSDEGKAPASVSLGPHRTGWVLHEVEDYLRAIIQKRDEQTP